MKKVLIIGPSPEKTKGGMATVILNQLDSRPENHGFHFEFLLSHEEGKAFDKAGVALRGLRNLWNKKDISLAHIHVASGASFYRKSLLSIICRLKKIPFILHIHAGDIDQFYNSSNPLAKKWIKTTLASADKVLVLSNHWKLFLNSIGIHKNVETLHNGVDISEFPPPVHAKTNINNFLFMGRLGHRKGAYDLIKAIIKLKEMGKLKPLNFYFIGDGEVEEVKSLVIQNGLSENVHLLGWLEGPSKVKIMNICSTVILPTYHEGLPMALLEAMICGKMVISTTVCGIPDLVEENKNGYLIAPGDVENLAHSILKVTENPEAVSHIQQNNVQKIKESYNLSLLNQKLFGLYHSIIDSESSTTVLKPINSPI